MLRLNLGGTNFHTMNESSIIFNSSLFQNLVNNMKNEIGRKITSLTLMTIMLAGGMTIGFSGFTPDAYAVNANLFVSAEDTGSYVDGAQVVEILIIDDDVDAASSPDVTVGGDAVAMTRTTDGNWYAYIADTGAVADVDGLAIDFGDDQCDVATTDSTDSTDVYCTNGTQNVPAAAKTTNPVITDWPFIQTYAFSSTIEIQYNKAGGTQITTLQFDDNADGLSLDRSDYPVGAEVHVTIGDHRLNIDPTSADIWTWNMDSGDKYYGAVTEDVTTINNEITPETNTIRDAQQANDACADCTVSITPNRLNDSGPPILVVSEIENRPLPAYTIFANGTAVETTVEEWFTVREIGGPNTAVFSSTTLANESILKIGVEDVSRGSSALVTYDGDDTDVNVKHSEATIEIQSPDDVWTSGLAIPIVIVDGDVNKNSLDSNDVDLTDPDSIIPTLITGDPFTLSEISDDTWIGWNIDGAQNTTAVNLLNRADSDIQSEYTQTSGPFILKGFDTTGIDGAYENVVGEHNIAVLQNSAETSSTGERAVLSFYLPLVNAVDDPVTEDREEVNRDLTDLVEVTGDVVATNDGPYANIDFLVIDFEDGVNALRDTLIEHGSSEKGHNFINYNVESLDVNVQSIEVLVTGDEDDDCERTCVVDTITEGVDGPSGYVSAFTNTTALFAADGDLLQVKLNFENVLDISENDGGEYPIVVDFFSFGFEKDGEASDERIANQIIRLLLEESGDDTASLEGTLEYVMINQLSIIDDATYGSISPIGDEVSFIVIEDLTGSSAPSVNYLDVDTTGAVTPVTAQEDAPSHSAVVTLNVDSLKTADTVTVTLEDLDLNTDSGLPDIYTVVDTVYAQAEALKGTPGFTESDIAYTDSNDNEYFVVDKDDARIDVKVADDNRGAVGSPTTEHSELSDGSDLGRLLDITFDDQRWMTHTDSDGIACTPQLNDKTGLDDTDFSLIETGDDTGIFVGTFALPAEFCREGSGEPESVTGLDIEVNYVDFRDASGETTEVGDSAGVKANTGSVALDRTVYPVPFGVEGDFEESDSTTPSERNSETRSLFPIHQNGMSDEGPLTLGLDAGEFLPQGDLIVYVTVTDPDFDVSASGKDSIAIEDAAPVTVSVIRGSDTVTVAQIGDRVSPIDEIAPDAGIFESSVTIRYNDGPTSTLCPDTPIGFKINSSEYNRLIDYVPTGDIGVDEDARSDAIDNYRDLVRSSISGIDFDERVEYNVDHQSWETFYTDDKSDIVYHDGCILQGDILQVEYNDPTDASGKPNSVTDSATFDLRNGVLQSDKSVYIIGSDMILTLIEPDFDLDSSQDETYDLDLIKWSSSAATVTMGDADGDDIAGAFDPEPLSFRETGPSTGIFQIIIEIPQVLDGSSLQRGEEIDLEYTDWGPSGSDYVGDEDEDIRLTVFTSNFGATIDLDQKVYSWTDKVYITVVAPDHNFDNNLIDEIGESDEDPLRVATKGYDLDNYRLVETGFDTGIFTGEVILTGFEHDHNGDGTNHIPIRTSGDGPTDGYLETPSDGGISVSYEFSEDETVFTSSIVRWNIGDVQWLEASYPASGTGVLRIIDPDMNLNPEAVDNLDVNIASNTDASGITLTVTETNEATGIFEGTVFFTTTGGSSGHRLRVSEGDTVTADYADGTLPLPYTTNDQVSITSTTIIGTIVPPLERAPATNLRIIDSFGGSIDTVAVDQQVQITADLTSGQDRDQDFAYLIQIQDGDGVTVSLSWIAGALTPGQSFSPSGSWTPTSAGTYDVTVFVWESIDNPTALSPPLSIDISVN